MKSTVPITKAERDELRAMHGRATEGEWRTSKYVPTRIDVGSKNPMSTHGLNCVTCMAGRTDQDEANAAFIARSHNLCPALLDLADERDELARQREQGDPPARTTTDLLEALESLVEAIRRLDAGDAVHGMVMNDALGRAAAAIKAARSAPESRDKPDEKEGE